MAWPYGNLGHSAAQCFLECIHAAAEYVATDPPHSPSATYLEPRSYINPERRPQAAAQPVDDRDQWLEVLLRRGFTKFFMVFVVISRRLPQMPGMVRAGERLLHFVVHPRRNAVHDVRFIEFAANRRQVVKRFAQKTCRIDQQCRGRQRDQKLLRRGAIEPLDVRQISWTSSNSALRVFQ